ncbi:MAG: CsgG/HfaB family protein, partial [Planctomycetota bacterium]
RQLGDILTARLSIYDQFQLVERKKLEDLLREQQLTLAGMVDTNQAVKVGKMAGARIMIFGRAFAVDRDLYIVAKIVGTETSQVKGVIARGKLESNLSEIIDQLVDKLAEGLEKWAPQLLPKSEKLQNRLKMLKRQLKGKDLPTVGVVIPEVHVNRTVADPAAETEIKKAFKEVGFNVIEVRDEITLKTAKDFNMAGVDIVITGEGFSELGTRIGGLVGCAARLEVQATERASHEIIASERTTRRAVDLSEAVAAKTALQAAGHELAIKIIEKIARQMKSE